MSFPVVLLTSILTLSITPVTSDIFVLLLAGSSGWGNYRHQADVCHAYQVFREKGIPEEHIIVMMYDDIAFHRENPRPGVIINELRGPDVYKDVPKDYIGNHVTADVFLAVLLGQKDVVARLTGKKNAKVLNTGPKDNVFVYYVDHGGYGVLSMASGRLLFAEEFISSIKHMHSRGRYSNLVIYIEACHSGSMFENLLPTDINAYGVTASDPDQNSYGVQYDRKLKAYISDVFSIAWINYLEARNLTSETLEDHFLDMFQRRYYKAHPQQYGDMRLKDLTLKSFLRPHKKSVIRPRRSPTNSSGSLYSYSDATKSQDIPIVTLTRQINSIAPGTVLRTELENKRRQMEYTFEQTRSIFLKMGQILERKDLSLNTILQRKASIQDFGCHRQVVENLIDACPKLDANNNPTFLSNLHVVVNLCNHHPQQKVLAAVEAATRSTPFCME